jgi:putative molybdopterin biosynthesis protein
MSAESPFISDVPAEAAHRAWREARVVTGCPTRLDVVRIAVGQALGRVTAEPVWALRSSPAFDSAGMDGIAVRAADTVGAAETSPVVLGADAFAVVDTGDPVPPGFDAVVMREHVHRVGDQAEIQVAVPPYQHVRSIGEDISTNELLLPDGHRLRPVDVAACAAAGVVELAVRRAPVVGIIPTGDEIRPIGSVLEPGDIPDTNSLMLASQARDLGCETKVVEIVRDDPQAITAAVRAMAAETDLVLLIAGSSAGRDDYSARVVDGAGSLAVHGVAVRPGHPVVLGVVDQTPVIGVPGYPVSAALTLDIFAAPVLAELEGAAPRERPSTTAHLARKLPSAIGMDDWVRVRLGRVRDRVVATPLPRGAGVLTSLVRADGLLVVPRGVEGHHAGEQVRVELLRGLGEIDRTIVAIGSHDLVLDLAASALRAEDPLVTLASSNVGSLGGLVALRDGLCHIAGSHLLDPDTGDYTLPFVDKLLGEDAVVIRLVHREQGLIVAPGNPLGLSSIDDLRRPEMRYVNRQRGAGTRALLDHELAQRGIDPADVSGYAREEHTHLAVAAAVSAGRVDAGLGILAAARAFGLDFVPVAQEPYDLVLRADGFTDDRLAPLWALLDRDDFRQQVEALGGYSCAQTGLRIR